METNGLDAQNSVYLLQGLALIIIQVPKLVFFGLIIQAYLVFFGVIIQA
jgi:hypothetical protein